jgi:hypothetical protein
MASRFTWEAAGLLLVERGWWQSSRWWTVAAEKSILDARMYGNAGGQQEKQRFFLSLKGHGITERGDHTSRQSGMWR